MGKYFRSDLHFTLRSHSPDCARNASLALVLYLVYLVFLTILAYLNFFSKAAAGIEPGSLGFEPNVLTATPATFSKINPICPKYKRVISNTTFVF